MSCMEWSCNECKWFSMDNKHYEVCPECNSKNIKGFFDERNDIMDDDTETEEEEY